MRFKKGDLLTSVYHPTSEPIARVDRITREGVVRCINLIACSTMDEGPEFRFSQKTNAIYILHKKTGNVQKRIQGGVSKFKKSIRAVVDEIPSDSLTLAFVDPTGLHASFEMLRTLTRS